MNLRRLVSTVLLLTLLVSGCLAQKRGSRRVPREAAESVIGIEFVDFDNLTYALHGQSYKLVGGYYARNSAPDAQWELQVVEAPYYGDLTGDGKNEAVVVLRYGQVGGPHTAEVRVYTLQKGTAVSIATFPVAETVNCELDHYVDLDDGKVRVERVYGRAARCDHNEITEYRWNGTRFMPIGDPRTMPCRCM